MPVNEDILLYTLIHTFNSSLNIDVCKNTQNMINDKSKIFKDLSIDDKVYYSTYAVKIAKFLIGYFENPYLIELNSGNDHDHDFRIHWNRNKVAYISMHYDTIEIRDIIPKKLMKICKYRKKSKIHTWYTTEYDNICQKALNKLKDIEKFSDISDKKKMSLILFPICNLIMDTLAKKRKCSDNLFKHLFTKSDRIVFKLYQNRFLIYDFSRELEEADNFKMKMTKENEISITFSNSTQFTLALNTNSSQIKDPLSLKFNTRFINMDELFLIESLSSTK